MATTARAASRRAAKNFFVFSLLEGFAPIYPVYMIMFEGRGYDLTSLSLLLSIWSLPVVFLELPSGILADRWSKRGVVSIGMAMKALCFILWALSPSFWAAALGFVLWGCQEAFCSGARQALIYEALAESGLEAEYEATVGLSGAIELGSISVSMIAGAAIYAMSPTLALGLSALSSLAASLVALGFHEERSALPASADPREFVSQLVKSVSAKSLVPLLAAACVAGAAYGTIDEFDGLWAADRHSVPIAWIGVWGAFRLSLQGLGGLAAGRFSRLLRGNRLGGSLAAAGTIFMISAFLPGLWDIPLYFSYFILMESISVIFEGRLQEAADDASRASLLSFSSLLMTLVAVLLSPLLGVAGDAGGLGWTVAICGLGTALSGVLLVTVSPLAAKVRKKS